MAKQAHHTKIANYLTANYVPFTTAFNTWEADGHTGDDPDDFVYALLIPHEDAGTLPPLESYNVQEGARFVLGILLSTSLMIDREI